MAYLEPDAYSEHCQTSIWDVLQNWLAGVFIFREMELSSLSELEK